MSVTQSQALIVCIPKEGKDKQLKNNKNKTTGDYHFAEYCFTILHDLHVFSARLKTVLPKLN